MKVQKVFNDFIIVEDVVIETKTEGGVISVSPKIEPVLEHIAFSHKQQQPAKLHVSDVVFKVIALSEKLSKDLGVEIGDHVYSNSSGTKFGNYRVIRSYDLICSMAN